jgi:hypothetical protein
VEAHGGVEAGLGADLVGARAGGDEAAVVEAVGGRQLIGRLGERRRKNPSAMSAATTPDRNM